jgi:hypothetical protein
MTVSQVLALNFFLTTASQTRTSPSLMSSFAISLYLYEPRSGKADVFAERTLVCYNVS